jgi:hypothetical protein
MVGRIASEPGGESRADTPSLRIIEVVGRYEGQPPDTLSPPLGDVLDPTALDELLTKTSDSRWISFCWHGYHIYARSAGACVDVDVVPATVETAN